MECTRIALLALEALRRLDIESPETHIAVVQGGMVGTLLVSRTPWTDAELDRINKIARERGFLVLWPYPKHLPVPTDSLVTQTILTGPEVLHERGFDMTPPSDDMPFFFQAFSLFKTPGAENSGLGFNELSVVLLRRVVILISLLAVAVYLLPFLLAGRIDRHPGFWRGSGYFAAIGLGFMLVELPWIQRFILYLGHPSYAATVVISALLLGAGLGSMQAGRLSAIGPAIRIGFILPLVIALTNLLFEPVFTSSMGWPLVLRGALGIAMLLPAGFAMGFPFPIGMQHFGDPNKAWFWAMNGVMSVVGSVMSLALAMVFGFTNVVIVGVVAYFFAWTILQLPGSAREA
jgi:hypothetical protein